MSDSGLDEVSPTHKFEGLAKVQHNLNGFGARSPNHGPHLLSPGRIAYPTPAGVVKVILLY